MSPLPDSRDPLFDAEFTAEKATGRRLAAGMLTTVGKDGRLRTVVVVLMLVWFGFGLYAGAGPLWYVAGIGALAFVLILQFLLLWRASSNAYPEYSVHNSSFTSEAMTLTGPNGTSVLPLANYDRIYRSGRAIVLRRVKGKSLAALPVELVPPGAQLLFNRRTPRQDRLY